MSYTREAVAETASAIPTMPAVTLREERVVDPYSVSTRIPKAQEAAVNKANGQQNISSSAPAESGKPEETVTLSPQMAALARKEQKFRQQEQAYKDKNAALEKERAEIAELKAMKAKLDSGDYSDLEKHVAYDKYTQYLLDKNAASNPDQEAIRALTAKVEGVEKAHQDDITKRFEAAVKERRNAVNSLVETNPEFTSIKKLKMQEAVVQHILDTWEHDNSELSPEQAAKEVAEVLKEKAKTWASILEEQQAQSVEEKKQLPPLKQGIKTLTNNMTATEVKRPVKSFQGMSDEQRYAEARRRAEEKLKLQQGR